MQTNQSILNSQMCIYKKLMNNLIYEKGDKSQAKLEERKDKFTNLAKSVLNIEGDAEFKNRIYGYIEQIASIKPGRKLFKALTEGNPKPVRVWFGNANKFCRFGHSIEVAPEELYAKSFYLTIDEKLNYKAAHWPKWILFAHELVHFLHTHWNFNENWRCTEIEADILCDTDNLEEQYTIMGMNHRLFVKKKNQLKPVDILCEDAFLLASGLPPRLDHRAYVEDREHEIDLKTLSKMGIVDAYYEWLERELLAIREIPKDKINNKEFIINFLKKYPLSITTLGEEVKKDKDFAKQLITIDHTSLKGFPHLCKDKDFILELIKINIRILPYISSELVEDEDFLAKLREYPTEQEFIEDEIQLHKLKI